MGRRPGPIFSLSSLLRLSFDVWLLHVAISSFALGKYMSYHFSFQFIRQSTESIDSHAGIGRYSATNISSHEPPTARASSSYACTTRPASSYIYITHHKPTGTIIPSLQHTTQQKTEAQLLALASAQSSE
jgi:hypothetical protein